jgi:hypothetical protein
MGVKYVKDFVFPKSGGFHGSNVQRYAKGGAVKKADGGMVPEMPVGKPMPVSLPPEMPVGKPMPEEPVKYVDPYEKAKRDILTGDFLEPPRKKPAPLPEEPVKFVDPYEKVARDIITGDFLEPRRKKPAPRSRLADMARRAANEMRQGMAPRRNSRGMAMIAPEDERMMGRTAPKRARGLLPLVEAPIRQTGYQMKTRYMPELNLDPEEIREYSRGRTFSPEVKYAKGGKVTSKKGQAKVGKVMREFKEGKLHSGSKKGPKVTNPKQAMAIALSEARKMKKAEGGMVEKVRNLMRDELGGQFTEKEFQNSLKNRRKMKELLGGQFAEKEYEMLQKSSMPKKELGKKPKMKMEDLALKKMRHAEKYAPGLDLDNIHSYELSQEAKKEKKFEKYAKGGKVHSDVKMDKAMVRKAVHKHESEKHPGESRTKLRRGGVPVHSGKPMYGGGK